MIRCLECGKSFKHISWKHLINHSMSVREYCLKHKLRRNDLLSDETKYRKVISQSKCGKFVKGLRPTGKSISEGMKRGRWKHFWGKKVSVSLKGFQKTIEHKNNISLGQTRFCKKFRKLTDDDIKKAREMYKYGKRGFGVEALAKKFCVSPKTMYSIIKKKHGYKHELR